jgi:hypothetical protein
MDLLVAAMSKHHIIPVWFFVGVLLAIYGVLIMADGIAEWSRPAGVVLAELHTPVWWGAVLATIGIVYIVVFRPRRR